MWRLFIIVNIFMIRVIASDLGPFTNNSCAYDDIVDIRWTYNKTHYMEMLPFDNFYDSKFDDGFDIFGYIFTDISKFGLKNHIRMEDDIKNECPREGCARKCCPFGEGYDILNGDCIPITNAFNPRIKEGFTELTNEVNKTVAINFLIGSLQCRPGFKETKISVTEISNAFYLKTTGELYVELGFQPVLIYNWEKYCIDMFITENGIELDAMIYYHENGRNYILNSICMLVTCFWTLLRVTVLVWLPEFKYLHGKILMAYLISFLVGFLLLGATQLSILMKIFAREVCVFISFIVYFSLLSAFFWRNVLCYDIWWTFSGKRRMSGYGANSRTRFYWYCAYACGMPTAMTILLATLEYTDHSGEYSLLPNVRLGGCFITGYSKFIYFYGPIIILFAVNLVFFTLTALKIATAKSNIKVVLKSRESCRNDQDTYIKQMKLYVQLFIVMSMSEVNWIFEMICLFYRDAQIILLISDGYNMTVPFIVLIKCTNIEEIWKMIKKRWSKMKPIRTRASKTRDGSILSKTTINSCTLETMTQSQEEIEMYDTRL